MGTMGRLLFAMVSVALDMMSLTQPLAVDPVL